ncbi:MAG: OmpA family protein [Polyangiales bacterium]
MRPRSLIDVAVIATLLLLASGRAAADGTGAGAASPTDRGYPPLDEQAEAVAERARTERGFAHPTTEGLLGGAHAVDATSGWPGTFRVAVQGGWFKRDGFVRPGDHQRQASARLTLNVTPVEHLELAAQLATLASQSQLTEPEVLQVVGDAHLFAKGFAYAQPWLALAGDAEVALLNGMGRIGIAGRATSVGLRASATADLRAHRRKLPLLARLNLRYLFDNTEQLVRDTERARYASLANPATRRDEYRHLLSPSERFALGVSRTDRLEVRLGVEAPLAVHERVLLSPLLEWSVAVPINRQGYDCVRTQVAERDGCLAHRGFASRPSTLTLGLRTQPYVRGLAVLLSVDVATSGHRQFVRELAPSPRYVLSLGLSYAYDPRPLPAPRARVERVEVPAVSVRGHVVGQVVEVQTSAPIASAIVHFEGASHSDLVASEQGMFRSAELAPGAQGMRVRAPGYREALCVAVVPTSGADVAARCELTPTERTGAVHGRITDAQGAPIGAARIALSGPRELMLEGQADGGFGGTRLPPGHYAVRVEASGFFAGRALIDVTAGDDVRHDFKLAPRSANPAAVLTPKRIALRRPIGFVGGTATLQPEATAVLVEVAALLDAHPEIALMEVQAHVDATGNGPAAMALTEQRAQAVRDALITAGVAPTRLRAQGFGASRPLVPNITVQNRARNRRVELLIR